MPVSGVREGGLRAVVAAVSTARGSRRTTPKEEQMKKTVFDPEARASLVARMESVTPDRVPGWGKLNAPRMVCHLNDAVRVALGEIPARSKGKGAFTNPLVRWLAIYVLPWPKGKMETAPEMLTSVPTEWRADLTTFRELLARIGERGPGGEWGPHPLFGKMPGKVWGDLVYRHIDYHLGQFGA
jgi:hypothetical protein